MNKSLKIYLTIFLVALLLTGLSIFFTLRSLSKNHSSQSFNLQRWNLRLTLEESYSLNEVGWPSDGVRYSVSTFPEGRSADDYPLLSAFKEDENKKIENDVSFILDNLQNKPLFRPDFAHEFRYLKLEDRRLRHELFILYFPEEGQFYIIEELR